MYKRTAYKGSQLVFRDSYGPLRVILRLSLKSHAECLAIESNLRLLIGLVEQHPEGPQGIGTCSAIPSYFQL